MSDDDLARGAPEAPAGHADDGTSEPPAPRRRMPALDRAAKTMPEVPAARAAFERARARREGRERPDE